MFSMATSASDLYYTIISSTGYSWSELFSRFSWDTALWSRANKPYATNRVNLLQDKMRHARGARSKSRIELEIMRMSEIVRAHSAN
jgi:hypothetical protein